MAKPPAPTQIQLQELAETRLVEAKLLMQHNKFDGAVYLAGYALEMAFKARICKVLDSEYPDSDDMRSFLTHRYYTLVKLAGLQKILDQKRLQDQGFSTNWSILAGSSANSPDGWSESWRYKTIGSTNSSDAQDFINALEDTQNGVLTWLKTIW